MRMPFPFAQMPRTLFIAVLFTTVGHVRAQLAPSCLAYGAPGGMFSGLSVVESGEGLTLFGNHSTTANIGLNLVRIAADGSVTWAKKFDWPNGQIMPVNMVANTHEGFLLLGYVVATMQPVVAQVDVNGAVEWARRYTNGIPQMPMHLAPAATGGCLVTGRTMGQDTARTMVLRLAPDGALLWDRVLGPEGAEQMAGTAGACLPDGGVVITGQSGTAGSIQAHCTVVRLADGGEPQWAKRFTIPGSHFYGSGIAVNDGHIGVCGFVAHGMGPDRNTAAMQLDLEGDLEWARELPSFVPSHEGAQMLAMQNGRWLMPIAMHPSPFAEERGIWEVNADGTTFWSSRYGELPYELYLGATATADGGVLLTGYREQDIMLARQAVVAKLDAHRTGCPDCQGDPLPEGLVWAPEQLDLTMLDQHSFTSFEIELVEEPIVLTEEAVCLATDVVGPAEGSEEAFSLGTAPGGEGLMACVPAGLLREGASHLHITDAAGRTLGRHILTATQTMIPTGHYASGAYLYQLVQQGHTVAVGRFVQP